jgi:hypothetical protein
MVSLRGANQHAAWCSDYEFQDVICGIDDVDLFTLKPGKAYGATVVRARLVGAVFANSRRTSTHGLQPSRWRRIDLFAYVCGPADLVYLSAVKGWKDRCRKRFVSWSSSTRLRLKATTFTCSLKDFDQVVLCFSGSVPPVQAPSANPAITFRAGADVFRFSPFPNPRSAPLTFTAWAAGSRRRTKRCSKWPRAVNSSTSDTIPVLLIKPRIDSIAIVANCAKRSRFFVPIPRSGSG